MSNHTPGPWMVATSNSWRRIVTKVRGLSVIEPYTCHDGHPDLQATPADLELAARAPELLARLQELEHIIAAARNLRVVGGAVPARKKLVMYFNAVHDVLGWEDGI